MSETSIQTGQEDADRSAKRKSRLLQEARSPDPCLNVLGLEGLSADIAKFKEDNSGGNDGILSFERLLPLPLGLNEDEAQSDWAGDHWGTTRNVHGGMYDDFLRAKYVFVTRSSPPLKWFAAIAKQYPTLDLSLEYRKHRAPWTGTMISKCGRIVSHIEYEPVERVVPSSNQEA